MACHSDSSHSPTGHRTDCASPTAGTESAEHSAVMTKVCEVLSIYKDLCELYCKPLLAVSSILTHPLLQNITRTVSLSCAPIKAEVMGFLKSSTQFNNPFFHIPFLANY